MNNDIALSSPYNKRVDDARRNLSIAMASRQYLHDWVGSEAYPEAKRINSIIIEESRRILFSVPGTTTIWYYKHLPTLGNKFRLADKCAFTGLPWRIASILSIKTRERIGSGEIKLEDRFLSKKDRS